MSEGVGLTLDPEFRYLEYAAPILSRFWKDSRSWTRSLTRAAEAAVEGAELSLELPRRAGRLLSRIERGEIAMNVRHEGLESVTADLQHMTNRLALAVVLAASVVALGVAMGVQHLPGLSRYLDVLFTMGFLGTVAFGVWLLISIARANRRRR
jgi:ubiquinone biosynthesis protein